MEFRLTYRGDLRSNGDLRHKWEIRKAFHPQLKDLWGQEPLIGVARPDQWDLGELCVMKSPGEWPVSIPIRGFTFQPLVNDRMHLLAELDILMLRPGPPGSLVRHGGDIDNRLKTLLDALRMPSAAEITSGPNSDETPFYCLLEDDRFITGLLVRTDRLLDARDPAEVVLTIKVRIHAGKTIISNLGIIG